MVMKLTRFRVEWKPQDLWIGVFWKTITCKTDSGNKPFATDVYVCLIPCVPLHFTFMRNLTLSVANVVMPKEEVRLIVECLKTGVVSAIGEKHDKTHYAFRDAIYQKFKIPIPHYHSCEIGQVVDYLLMRMAIREAPQNQVKLTP